MAQEATRPGRSAEDKRKFVVLVTAGLVSSLIMLDSNIVAIALPSIARTLGASFTEIEWVVSAYILTFAALLLAAGSYADKHGRKLAMLVGLAIFTIASGLCGLATSALMLNLSRALQGVGASLLLTASLAVINHTFSGMERAKAYAFWGACLGIAITSGPIVGGVITALFGWRWAFLMNLPIGAALFIAAYLVVDESMDHEAKRLDYAGIITFSTGLFFLIWALIDGNALGWTSYSIGIRLVAALVLLVGFYFVEAGQPRPMVDFSLFRQPTFLGSAFAMLGYAGGAQVLIFFLPLLLQNAFGFAPAAAGLAMLPFALPMFLTPRFGAGLASQYSGRTLLTLGLAITTIGNLLLFAFTAAHQSYPVFAVGMLVAGIGAGLLNSETAKVMQGAVPAQRAGMASGISATTRFVGLLLGVAALGAVLSSGVSNRFISADAVKGLDASLVAQAAKRAASGDITGVIGMLGGAAQESIRSAAATAFAGGFGDATLIAAIVAAISAVLTFVFVRAADTAPGKAGKSSEVVPVME
jgi:EmrB/QacA subfamily drug resistance transporter